MKLYNRNTLDSTCSFPRGSLGDFTFAFKVLFVLFYLHFSLFGLVSDFVASSYSVPVAVSVFVTFLSFIFSFWFFTQLQTSQENGWVVEFKALFTPCTL